MMIQNNSLTPHETLFLHEILTFKNTCAVKSASMQNMIADQELKNILKEDVNNTKRQIQDIQTTLTSRSQCQ